MARFYPLYVRRSDGKIEVLARGKRKELNQPTDEQLDQRPDKEGVSDFYREVKPEETKHLDWRRKLGGMLARELDRKHEGTYDNGHILVAFPENYRLYEHVKKTERDGKLEVKSKTHAAGGNDRQDAYLYGHPAGRRKRFRSPNDFFPHLLWLCTDESGDPDNCSCKICSPEDLENLVPGAKVKTEKSFKQEPGTTHMSRQSSVQSNKSMLAQTAPRAAPTPSPAQLQTATPLVPPKHEDQKVDRQYGTFMYRPGELVWFSRGAAWGLGAVLQRWLVGSNGTPRFYYSVQPLSHPFEHPRPIVKQSESELRPWLAWSVPKFTNMRLNVIQTSPRYESADWAGMMQKRYGEGDLEVDASILAAKMVDSTYTPFSKGHTAEPEPGVIETHYDGLFLGCEKVWVGDPVRLQIGSGTDIIVVHDVVERKRLAAMNPSQILEQSCKLIGDVYTLAAVTHRDPQQQTLASPNNNPHLPPRLTQDLAFRNGRSIQRRQTANYWKLIAPRHRVDLSDIKGRWYEASILLPILHPQLWANAEKTGDIQESSLWMNSRGDCLNSNRPASLPKLARENIRKETRNEAFGQSIAPNTEFKDGIGPPQPENLDSSIDLNIAANDHTAIDIDPKFDTADDTMGANHGSLDDFMNLDGIDDGNMSGFGGQYF